MKRNFYKSLINAVRELFIVSDPMIGDINQEGELLMARIRFVLVLTLMLIPIKSVVFAPELVESWVGVTVAAFALFLATLILLSARKKTPHRSISWVSAHLDVILVTSAEVGFLISNKPIVASNNMVVFALYIVVIAATALRAEPNLTRAVGFSAIIQYAIVATVASHLTVGIVDPLYGSFSWDSQFSRFILLILITLLTVAIVARNRNFWITSMHDKLTGLHNRRFFDEFLEYKIAESKRHKRTFALVFLDLDHFKQVNDNYGHNKGDEILRKVANQLDTFFRDSDLVSRYGGEEFTVIMPEVDPKKIIKRLEKFRTVLHGVDNEIKVSATIGIAFFPRDASTGLELIAAADSRMYNGKKIGRDRVILN
ncbi:MAG: hypothetical protein LDLANPLL_02778 [Turneriella sp.]|nr:hypothetical protein [Turneriella sp.]